MQIVKLKTWCEPWRRAVARLMSWLMADGSWVSLCACGFHYTLHAIVKSLKVIVHRRRIFNSTRCTSTAADIHLLLHLYLYRAFRRSSFTIVHPKPRYLYKVPPPSTIQLPNWKKFLARRKITARIGSPCLSQKQKTISPSLFDFVERFGIASKRSHAYDDPPDQSISSSSTRLPAIGAEHRSAIAMHHIQPRSYFLVCACNNIQTFFVACLKFVFMVRFVRGLVVKRRRCRHSRTQPRAHTHVILVSTSSTDHVSGFQFSSASIQLIAVAWRACLCVIHTNST